MTVEYRAKQRISVTQSEMNALITFVVKARAVRFHLPTDVIESVFQGVCNTYGSHLQELKRIALTGSIQDADAIQFLTDHQRTWLAKSTAQWRMVVDELERSRLFEASAVRRQRREQILGSRQALRDAKQRMQLELQKMGMVEQGLRDVSTNIRTAGSMFDIYEYELRRAQRAFKRVLQRANEDVRYVNWAWRLLLGTCVYILVKRFGFLRILGLVLYLCRYIFKTVWLHSDHTKL